jgi:hypothetical protein
MSGGYGLGATSSLMSAQTRAPLPASLGYSALFEKFNLKQKPSYALVDNFRFAKRNLERNENGCVEDPSVDGWMRFELRY